jgi:predicted secreted protein
LEGRFDLQIEAKTLRVFSPITTVAISNRSWPESPPAHATTAEEVVAAGAQEGAAPAAVAAEEAVAAEAQEETPAEGGLVDIASILGAPTVTIVRSSL